jgi:hypothetical protein
MTGANRGRHPRATSEHPQNADPDDGYLGGADCAHDGFELSGAARSNCSSPSRAEAMMLVQGLRMTRMVALGLGALIQHALPVVQQQLLNAGIRLAKIIDENF